MGGGGGIREAFLTQEGSAVILAEDSEVCDLVGCRQEGRSQVVVQF